MTETRYDNPAGDPMYTIFFPTNPAMTRLPPDFRIEVKGGRALLVGADGYIAAVDYTGGKLDERVELYTTVNPNDVYARATELKIRITDDLRFAFMNDAQLSELTRAFPIKLKGEF